MKPNVYQARRTFGERAQSVSAMKILLINKVVAFIVMTTHKPLLRTRYIPIKPLFDVL